MPDIVIGLPHVSKSELALMDQVFASNRRCYLEFGLGGSTLLAIRSGFSTIVAVDSDPEWVQAVKRHPEFAERIGDGSAAVLHADIGPVKEWGMPHGRNTIQQWSNYIAAPWIELSNRGIRPDLVFIDGRFRVACALSVFMACLQTKPGEAAPLVLLHDVTPDRPEYQEVFDFFDAVQSVESLFLLAPRTDRLTSDALARLLKRQFNAL